MLLDKFITSIKFAYNKFNTHKSNQKMRESKIKIVDNFVWLVVTDKAEEIYFSDLFELYALYDDGSESLIESFEHLATEIEKGIEIGVEVGHINN